MKQSYNTLIEEISNEEDLVETSKSKIKIAIQFILEFLFSLFIIFPFYFVISLIECFKLIKLNWNNGKKRNTVKIILIYLIDCIMPLSVLGIIYEAIISYMVDYSIWLTLSKSCFIFFSSFVAFSSYMKFRYSKNEEIRCTKEYWLSEERLEALGLGIIKRELLEKYKLKMSDLSKLLPLSDIRLSQQETKFKHEVQHIAKTLNIDQSFFYFMYINDEEADPTK